MYKFVRTKDQWMKTPIICFDIFNTTLSFKSEIYCMAAYIQTLVVIQVISERLTF